MNNKLVSKIRCAWAVTDPVNIEYHDQEWGVPIYDDRLLFEFLILEGAQAGLSWLTILKRRDNYRNAFDNFNAKKMAAYSQTRIAELLQNAGIIRNKLKIQAAVLNAQSFLRVQQEFGSFSKYIWGFTDGSPICHHWQNLQQVPAKNSLSDTLSKDLKQRGFKFVGSTICYAFMQAVGMVNDHTTDCFRYAEINQIKTLMQV